MTNIFLSAYSGRPDEFLTPPDYCLLSKLITSVIFVVITLGFKEDNDHQTSFLTYSQPTFCVGWTRAGLGLTWVCHTHAHAGWADGG